ncbi:MAG TPA: caspase family protein [Polyangiaceae bacterium]|nr:caspase family protein [Polyangiaceae bacterium]
MGCIARLRRLAFSLFIALAGHGLAPALAHADVQRYALVVGNDVGAPGDERLHYAESDATKLMSVLTSLGDFAPENSVLLLGRGAAEVQRVLISLNARIRAEAHEAVLLVYYSGHADARALHLGGEELELSLLTRLVQGSAAAFRMLLVDACRSGALTRVKGARRVAPFELGADERLSGEGVAFLTSSTADEAAQESDELRGSFFTHYLVSGLRGAADANASGSVTVEEAYDYAYQHTLRASSQTLYGLQHPTFQFDLKGKGGIALTWPSRFGPTRTGLELPTGRTYLLFARDAAGPVVAEVDAADVRRTLALEPGRYFVRARAADHLLEGSVELAPGEQRRLSEESFERVEYAQLARKGGAARHSAHGPFIGYAPRTPLWPEASFCQGARGGYSVDLPQITLAAALGACRSHFDNAVLEANADEFAFDLSAARVFDFPLVSLSVGVSAGASWLRQSFDTAGRAPARNSLAGSVALLLGAAHDLSHGYYLLAELAGQLYVFERQPLGEAGSELGATFALRPTLGAGKHF